VKSCAWCANEFDPPISYQIYCSPSCRESATREKISERYKANKLKNRSKKPRKCAGGCEVLLSIYNDNNFCSSCMINNKKVDKMLKELRGLFDYEQR
jgi:hypothetical protein